MQIPQVQIPDFAGTIQRAEQAQMSRLQAMAAQRELAADEAVSGVLANGGVEALFGADPAASRSLLTRLAGAGRQGLSIALPIYQQQQLRLSPMTPEQAQALGLRPGTVAMVDGLGRPQILQQPDLPSAEARAWQLQVAGAGRAPPAPLILGPGQNAYDRGGRLIASGPARPTQSPFEASEGGDAQILATLGPLVASGQATPQQQQTYAIAATRWQSSGQVVQQIPDPNNPGVMQQAVVPRPLPPGFPAPPPLQAPQMPAQPVAPAPGGVAPPAAPAAPQGAPAAPQQQGGVAIPGTNLAAAPPDPNAPRVIASSPTGGPSGGDRTRLRALEVEAQGVRDALAAFREARANASMQERVQAAAGLPTALSTAWSNAALLAKGEALYNLGVLNGPDLQIIQRTLSDPATIRGLFTGQETTEAQIKAIETLIDQRLATARVQFGGQPPTQTGQAAPGTPTMRFNPATGLAEPITGGR